MLEFREKPLKERLRAQTTRTKTPMLAIIFRVPVLSMIPYRTPHISAESLRTKMANQPYFLLTSLRFIFRSRNIFLLLSSPPTFMMTP